LFSLVNNPSNSVTKCDAMRCKFITFIVLLSVFLAKKLDLAELVFACTNFVLFYRCIKLDKILLDYSSNMVIINLCERKSNI